MNHDPVNLFTLTLAKERLAVCRLAVEAAFPDWAQPGDILAMIRTRRECSVVCAERYVPPEVVAERGWRGLEVQGPLDFALTGVLAQLSGILASASISLFALSTYDTDWILVKEDRLPRAIAALQAAGHQVVQ